MDARWSHALVAVAAVGLTVIGYTVYDALSDTARMLAGDGQVARAETRADRPADGAPDEERERKRDHKDREGKEEREGRPRDGERAPDGGALAGTPEGAAEEERERGGGNGRTAARAAELGLTPHELRERRAERDGITVEELRVRKEARSEWRAQVDPDDLLSRKEARRGGTPEQQAELQAARDQRQELFEADPSLRDAAEAIRKLKEMAGEAPPPP
jgi:hypothetical protein